MTALPGASETRERRRRREPVGQMTAKVTTGEVIEVTLHADGSFLITATAVTGGTRRLWVSGAEGEAIADAVVNLIGEREGWGQ